MTDFDIEAARARFEEFEAARQRARPEHEEQERAPRPATRDYDRRPRHAPKERRRMAEPMAARTSSAGGRIAAIKTRPDDHPLGSLARPLPMFDPLAEARATAKANGDRLREVFRDVQ
ncbi:MAG: hypothetical protein M3306_17715 [Actinomycetota bacterium]|nr:hypothetical protein [Actinomycetota bacterium]